jgi:transcriptional regulator with XRE-family HTH domain
MKSELSKWLEKKYLEWQLENGKASILEFSEYLDMSQSYVSQIMNSTRETIGMKTAVKIADKLQDNSILDILGYSKLPSDSANIPFDSLPPQLQEKLSAALEEIERTLKTRSIQPDSPEGLEISLSVLQKFGFSVNINSKG